MTCIENCSWTPGGRGSEDISQDRTAVDGRSQGSAGVQDERGVRCNSGGSLQQHQCERNGTLTDDKEPPQESLEEADS